MVHESIKEFIRTKPGMENADILRKVLQGTVWIVFIWKAWEIKPWESLEAFVPVVIAFIIVRSLGFEMIEGLVNDTSKVYKIFDLFTRLVDPKYKEYLRIADTNRLINIIENNYKHCSEFKSNGSNEKNGENSTSAEHSQDEDREFEALLKEESESLEPFYQLERKCRRKLGRLQKSLKILRKEFPKKDVTKEQRKRYQSFYKQLEKIVVIPNRKSEKDFIVNAMTLTIAGLAVVVSADTIEWTEIRVIIAVVIAALSIYLLTKLFTWINAMRTTEENAALYAYRLLEDVVIFQIPIYDVDNKFINDYWEAQKYFDWICSKIGYIEVFQKLGVPKL